MKNYKRENLMKKLMVAVAVALAAAVSLAGGEDAAIARLISKDGVTTTDYAAIQAAFDAAQAGDTVMLLSDCVVDKAITLENKDVVFDLGHCVMTNAAEKGGYNFDDCPTAFEITDTKFVLTNGVLDAGWGTAIRSTGKGSRIVLAQNSEVKGLYVWTLWTTDATVDVYGKITISDSEGSCLWLSKKGGVINIYDSAELRSYKGDIVRFECPEDGSAEEAPTLNIYGGSLQADGYPVVHAIDCMKYYGGKKSSGRVVIKGGTFGCDNYNYNAFGGFIEIYEGMTYQPLDGECTARFVNSDHGKLVEPDGVARICAEGYAPVQDEDGLFSIRKVSEITVVAPVNGTLETSVTNMVPAGVEVEFFATPAAGYVVQSVTTNGTALAYGATSFVMPDADVELVATFVEETEDYDWPEEWPADADDMVKLFFADWSEQNPGADYSLDAVKAAFLLNVNVGDELPEIKIEGISVADGAAEITAGSDGIDLANVNGAVYVEGSDELADWTPTVVVPVDEFASGKAVFEVKGAKFMKVCIGFKCPQPEDR